MSTSSSESSTESFSSSSSSSSSPATPGVFVANLDQDVDRSDNFRRIVWTQRGQMQLVYYTLHYGQGIPWEVHRGPQFIRVERGKLQATLFNGKKQRTFRLVADAQDTLIVPAECSHQLVNRDRQTCKFYAIYSPPEHKE